MGIEEADTDGETYGITEKEMLAVFWGMNKFAYELRGRKFHLMTDHKALEEIRSKPYFENNRINRWIEKIQEFDFTVEYVKGAQMVDADALSRQYEQPGRAERDLQRKARAEKAKAGKWNRHVEERDGKEFWRFDTGKVVEIPRIEKRQSLVIETIVDAYNDTLHTGIGCTPNEAWEGDRDEVQLENSKLGKYAGRMKKGFREEFEPGQLVRVANRENLGADGKRTW